ncbi:MULTISPECIES: ABC transporter permease [Galbibacter]|uniref:ABC transporter permease n=1 Tax=Galbibacter pacificus TaxID=2996052 RepID=A0ABT6FV52_9FLAO|nr:ABC transporter permease [Galbibacter pacificus]MDG3583398.1 ABC transporter permease [Galbibacter pacificus]MDG3587125.1 ABC transporter permease [Galbibacter pacificus]
MKDLIIAEVYKLFKQSKTFYAITAILIIEFLVLVSAYYQGSAIIDILLSNLKDTFYFEGNLLNGNLLVYLILNTFWFHLPLILIIVVSGMLTSEYKDNTLQTIMLQPIEKWKFVMSKYIVAIGFTISVVFLTALTAFVFSYVFFGKGDLVIYLGTLNFFNSADAQYRLQMAFLSGTVSMVFFSVASMTIAVIMKETTKTWIIAALFLIVSNVLQKVEINSVWYHKWFFPKLNNAWQLLFYQDIPWQEIYRSNILLMGYIIVFVFMGVGIFNKNDIK